MDQQISGPNEYIALVRHIGTAVGIALTSRGLVTAENWQLYSGVIIAIIPPVYAFLAARASKRKIAAITKVAVAAENAKPEVHSETQAVINVASDVRTALNGVAR